MLTTAAVVEDDSDEEPVAPASATEAAGQPPQSDAQPAGTLSVGISTQLHQFWRHAEQSYLTTITQVLAHLRCSREAATLWFSDNRHKFTSFMERDSPDKQKLVGPPIPAPDCPNPPPPPPLPFSPQPSWIRCKNLEQPQSEALSSRVQTVIVNTSAATLID